MHRISETPRGKVTNSRSHAEEGVQPVPRRMPTGTAGEQPSQATLRQRKAMLTSGGGQESKRASMAAQMDLYKDSDKTGAVTTERIVTQRIKRGRLGTAVSIAWIIWKPTNQYLETHQIRKLSVSSEDQQRGRGSPRTP